MGALQQALLMYGAAGGSAGGLAFANLYERFYWPGRTQEPGSFVSLNKAHNLTRGLVFCTYHGGPRWSDLISGGLATRAGGISGNDQWLVPGLNPLMYGYGKGNGGTENASYPFSPEILSIGTEHTWLSWVALSSLNAFSSIACLPWANGTWVSPFVAIDFARSSSTSSASFGVTVSGPTNFSAVSDTGMIVADNVTRMLAGTRSGDTVIFYVNGFQHGASKSLGTSTAPSFNGGQPLTVGNRSSSSTGNSTGGTFFLTALWNRALNPSEIAQLYLQPLILLRPTIAT